MAANRQVAFVLASTDHGTMIVNRNDHATGPGGVVYGVGIEILSHAHYTSESVALLRRLLDLLRQVRGDGLIALDGGANLGVMTIELARHMTGWGSILAIEAQERVFYALAGNIAINNCFNARALNAVLAERPGMAQVPVPDYLRPGSFGSLEMRRTAATEFIGQPIDYGAGATAPVAAVAVDALGLPRLDLLKVDVEGMELDVIAGARATLARHHPLVFAEHLKVGFERLRDALAGLGYAVRRHGRDLLGVHADDPVGRYIHWSD